MQKSKKSKSKKYKYFLDNQFATYIILFIHTAYATF